MRLKETFVMSLPPMGKRPQVIGTLTFEQPTSIITVYHAPGVTGTAGDIVVETWPEEQEQVQGAVPETGPEDPLQAPDCQSLPVEGSIGSLGPLPDAVSNQIPEVEGVGGYAESEAAQREDFLRFWSDYGLGALFSAAEERPLRERFEALRGKPGSAARDAQIVYARRVPLPLAGLTMNRPLRPGIAAWTSLDKLVADAIAGGAASGTLVSTCGDFRASASWKDGAVEHAYMSKASADREP